MTARRGASQKKAKGYVVTGALITVKVGSQLLQFSKGDVLPDGVDEDSLKHHLDTHLIEESEVPAQAEPSDDDE